MLASSRNGLVRGTSAAVAELDQLLAAHAQNWRLERMAVIDRLILRMARLELLHEPETPARSSSTRPSSWRGRSAPTRPWGS